MRSQNPNICPSFSGPIYHINWEPSATAPTLTPSVNYTPSLRQPPSGRNLTNFFAFCPSNQKNVSLLNVENIVDGVCVLGGGGGGLFPPNFAVIQYTTSYPSQVPSIPWWPLHIRSYKRPWHFLKILKLLLYFLINMEVASEKILIHTNWCHICYSLNLILNLQNLNYLNCRVVSQNRHWYFIRSYTANSKKVVLRKSQTLSAQRVMGNFFLGLLDGQIILVHHSPPQSQLYRIVGIM